MSTVIPSKNIFNIENKKVIKNQIKSLEVAKTKVTTPEQSVYSETFIQVWTNTSNMGDGLVKRYDKFLDFEEELPNQAVVSKYWTPFKTRNIDDYYIFPLETTFNLNITVAFGDIRADNSENFGAIDFFSSAVKQQNISIPLKYIKEETPQEFLFTASGGGNDALDLGFKAKIVLLNKPSNLNLPSKGLKFKIYVPTRYYYLMDDYVALTTDESIEIVAKTVNLDETENTNFPLTEISQPTKSIDQTEFSHDTTTYNGEIASENLAKNIIANYKNGKETAVIRCSVPEDLSVFEIGDEVIPMVFGANREDKPMSNYRDGTPKVFNVVGTKFIYDGAVWQELTLQEKTQSV